MTAHTPTPWKIDEADDLPLAVIADNEDGDGIAEIGERTPLNLANAARIVAAVNYCEGLDSAELSTLTALDRINQREAMDRQIARLSAQRDALLAAAVAVQNQHNPRSEAGDLLRAAIGDATHPKAAS